MSYTEIIIGIVAGVISSVGFWIITFLVHPHIKVSSEICKSSDERNVYRIKLLIQLQQ